VLMSPSLSSPSASPTFAAPDRGFWMLDSAHQTQPSSLLTCGPWERGYAEGFRRGFAEVGALLETLEATHVNGWFYYRPRPLGAPPTARRPPPRLVFKLLLRLVPALRARVARAEKLWTERPWLSVPKRWFDDSLPGFAARAAELRRRAGGPLGVEEAVDALSDALALFEEATARHLELAVPECIAFGNVLVLLEDHLPGGAGAVTNLMGLVRGAQVESCRPRELQRAAVAAIAAAGAAEHLAATATREDADAALRDIRGLDPAVDAAVGAYLEAYGLGVLGDNLRAPTLEERPEQVLVQLRAQLGSEERREGEGAADLEACIAASIPESHRPAFAEAVDEARRSVSSRESRASLLLSLLGLCRKLGLRLGEALVAAGRAVEASDAFELRAEELGDVRAGAGPDAAALAARSARYFALLELDPPLRFGEAGAPPPATWLPPASARLMRAVDAYVSRFEETVDVASDRPPLAGLGVSPGIAEGRAIVVRTSDDLARLAPGDILVTMTTGVSFNAVIPVAAGLVTERGGLASHASIVSRELGLPCVVGCRDATAEIPDGALVRVDGSAGRVEILASVAPTTPSRSRGLPAGNQEHVAPRIPATPGTIVTLDEADDRASFGGKAAPLATALRAGLPVPPGLALDADFTEAVAAADPEHIQRLRRALGALPGPWAVRSSGLDEDGTVASFAGIHHTALGVESPDAVVDAVGAIWRSAYSSAASAYRARRGVHGRARMAVVVQHMLQPEWSGVRFGCDPVSGEDVRLIEVAPGLGTAVVDGETVPERVRTDARGVVLAQEPGDHGVVVDDGTLASIHALCTRCDMLFAGPQDVELAWAGDTLYLLQSRPMTTGRA
jgi:phosphohistidine swiveling domain-containing protein